MAIARDGSLWGWGENRHGQLGDGTMEDRLTPTPVATGSSKTWAKVSAGAIHTVAVATDGTLWAWGDNDNGQVGDGTAINRTMPTPIGVNLNRTWVSVSAAAGHNIALDDSGALWGWGVNYYGQLGDGTTTDRLSPVRVVTSSPVFWSTACAGGSTSVDGFSLARSTNGTLWAWGNNIDGQLGIGTPPLFNELSGGAIWGPP